MKEGKKLSAQIDYPVLVAAMVLFAVLLCGAIIGGNQFESILGHMVGILTDRFTWFYILTAVLCVGCGVCLLFGKWGDIRLGGNEARPKLKTGTWFALSFTGGIAVGICFFGVAGPLNYYLQPPAFLQIEGETSEAIIPSLVYTYVHWALTPYVLLCFAGMIMAYAWFNLGHSQTGGAILAPLLGEGENPLADRLINILTLLVVAVGITNMGLSATQLLAGIRHIFGISIPISVILMIYAVLIYFCASSGLQGWMSRASRFNIVLYVAILIFVLLCGPTERLLGTFLTSVGEYLGNYVQLTTFADPVLQTGFIGKETIFYYSWNIAPCLLAGIFYAKLAYGRTLRQFVIVQMIVPTIFIMFWFSVFGGSAIYSAQEGNTVLTTMLVEQGNAIATFSFLDTMPASKLLQMIYLVMICITYTTSGQSQAISIPKVLLKSGADEGISTRPLILGYVLVSTMMTLVILHVGGAASLGYVTILTGFPITILLFVAVIGFIRSVFCPRQT